jgi:ABC-type Fe3+ transport system permease subunit
MDTPKSSAKRELGFLHFLVARLAGALLVAAALPVAHLNFGEMYPGDGQQEFGFIIMFTIVGFGAAFVYLMAGTLGHYLVRKRPLRTKLWVEVGVLLIFLIPLVYGGITAHYQ